jgi:putative ABC transport system substrate-binding protein
LGAWIHRLRELGYVEGKNLTVEWRFADGNNDRLPDLAAELVRLNPDLIIASGTPAARAMQKATSTIPIVIVGVADPVGFGLVASLSRPGGNITGTSIMATDVSIKSLEFLLTFAPNLKQVAVLVNPTNPIDALALKQIQTAAVPVGVAVAAFEASNVGQIDAAFAAIAQSRAGALIVAPDPFLVNQARQITELAARNRLPAIYPFRPFVEAGGLMCYGQNIYENNRLAANYIERIFKGAKPGDLPVEQPTQLELVVNRKAAEAIGLKVPQSILLRANHVIE